MSRAYRVMRARNVVTQRQEAPKEEAVIEAEAIVGSVVDSGSVESVPIDSGSEITTEADDTIKGHRFKKNKK